MWTVITAYAFATPSFERTEHSGALNKRGAMPGEVDWSSLIEIGTASRPQTLLAETYLKSWSSASQPVLVECSNGQVVVVKGMQAGRMIVNDQVVGALGHMMGAPVPAPELVLVTDTLVKVQPEMGHIKPGVAHGSQFLPNCADREELKHAGPENNTRFARLAVLYGWMQAGDNQFIYDNTVPPTVHSVDHGHFFPNGPDWTESTLQSAAPVQLEPTIEPTVTWTTELFEEMRNDLSQVTDQMIAEAVARPPDDWGVSASERMTLAAYLSDRRDAMAALLAGRANGA